MMLHPHLQQQTRRPQPGHGHSHGLSHNHSHSNNVAYHHNQHHAIQCANCGCAGHVHKRCNHPITSYGIICFRAAPDGSGEPEYLMVQRKDSLAYVELLRGKYQIGQRQYIMQLLSNMTERERQALLQHDFDQLWQDLWQDCSRFQRECMESKQKFQLLKAGFYLRPQSQQPQPEPSQQPAQQSQTAQDADNVCFFNLAGAVAATTTALPEPEWGFPKGRRNINEGDLHCALREFREETGIHPHAVALLKNNKPVEEVFSGSNRVRYRHVYYLARAVTPTSVPQSQQPQSQQDVQAQRNSGSREISDVRWFKYDEAQARIRDMNVERKELFARVHAYMVKHLATAAAGQTPPSLD